MRACFGHLAVPFALVAACGGETASAGDATGGAGAGTGAASSGGNVGLGGAGAGGAGSTGGTSGTGGAAGMCSGPNPAGCVVNGCAPSLKCDTSVGCVASSCACTGGGWACTDDCGGGTCVPVQLADCSAQIDAIAQKVSGFASCTVVVRLAYESKAVLAHAIICGPSHVVDEIEARAVANADSGYGHGELWGGPLPVDEWIFFQSPGDFGGVSIVSARNGLSVFGASIVWAGSGDILYPKTWATGSLGSNCAPVSKPPTRYFNLHHQQTSDPGMTHALDVVWTTALPAGLAKQGKVLDVVVALYAPSPGFTTSTGFLTETAEYVVMINSG